MTGPITWEMAISLATILGALAAVWWRIESRIGDMVKPLNGSIAALHGEVRLLDKQLADHKLFAAETYVRRHDLSEVRDEIIGRLDRLDGRIDVSLADRRNSPRGPAKP